MSGLSRRRLIATSLGAAAAVSAVTLGVRRAGNCGLIPPDSGGLYGVGATLTYAAHRLLVGDSLAREFRRDQISKVPYVNGETPNDDNFRRLQDRGFAEWRLAIDGMVSRPGSFSPAEFKSYTSHSHITQLACEEGWSYIAEWTGAPLRDVLQRVGALEQARFVVFHSIQSGWWESLDMADALHPQTLIAYGMNGGDLPVGNGGPLRLRIPRQLGYKSLKYITRMTVTDSVKGFGKGLGSGAPEAGYSWYAGI